MQEDNNAKQFLVVLLVVTFIIGGLVLVFKSDYRTRDNALSNIEYYPHIRLDEGSY